MFSKSNLNFLTTLEGTVEGIDPDLDHLENIGVTHTTEGLDDSTSVNEFWKSLPPRMDYPEPHEHPVDSDEDEDMNSEDPAFQGEGVNEFTLEFNSLVECWSWDEKDKIMKQLLSIPSGSVLHIHARNSGRCNFREFIDYLSICNLIRMLKFKVVVHISMYITPYSLMAINLADEVNYGKYVIFSLHGLFLQASDIPPKYKACVTEMNRMLRDILKEKKLLSEDEINKLSDEPQSLAATKMMFND